jgi:hypothetical protein
MIRFLAKVFRQVHWIAGISAPPPGTKERKFVLIWLGVVAFVLVWCAGIVYLMLYVF